VRAKGEATRRSDNSLRSFDLSFIPNTHHTNSFTDFIQNLLPCIILACFICALYLKWYYRSLWGEEPVKLDYGELREKYGISKPILLYVFLGGSEA